MGRQLKLLVLHLLAAAFGAALLLAVSPRALAGPTYVVEPCCNLCPNAGNRAAYTTKFLQSFTTLVQGKDGWLFRTDDDLRTSFGPDAEGSAALKRFVGALRDRGVALVVVYQPSRGLMHADKLPPAVRKQYNVEAARNAYVQTLQRFRSLGIVVPELDQLAREPGKTEYFYRGDHHWTPAGAERTALITAEAIRGMKVFAGIPQKTFTTERAGIWSKRGTLQKAATQLCGHGYADQYAPRFVTASEGSGDLFEDESAPAITLAGTSNSDSAYNFAGFLEQALGVEVLNESVAGGGHEGALLQYLGSEAFRKSPPKILVWELETYHNLSKTMFYRQVTPLVGDGCGSRKPLLSRTVALKGESTEALFNGGGSVMTLPSGNHLLDVRFSDPSVKNFKGVVWYTNGSKETISIEHSDYIETNGRFVVELRSDGEWADRGFLSLDVLKPPTARAGTTLTSQVCASNAAQAPAPAQQPPKPGHSKKRKA
jgi:alginate biosynthesis protein AlgX